MDWIADVGSVLAAGDAVGAAIAATVLVRITQKQNELAQREFFSGFRPIVIPTWPLDMAQGTNAQKYVDLTTTQTVRIKNIGPGVALNLSLVLFGPPPELPGALLPNRVMAWLEPPLASGEERTLSLPVGQSNFNGDVYVANDPNLTLFAPPHPSKQDFMLGSADMFVARLTITYHDVFSASTQALTTSTFWVAGSHAGIKKTFRTISGTLKELRGRSGLKLYRVRRIAVREATVREEGRVREYVNAESPPEDGVTLVQKLSSRKILGRWLHLYDVRTKRHRWWVISDPLMNLYSQADFHEVDKVLAYHIGLCTIIADRSRKHWGEPEGILAGAWRRFQRAVDAFADADEAEAFQGVGVMCREALLALIREEAKDAATEHRPPLAGFKPWSKILLASLSREQLRDYMTSLADNTWDLVEWLQHYTGASPADAELVLDVTGHFISTYARVKLRQIDGEPERCPRCESYRLEDASYLNDQRVWVSVTACAGCGWQSEPVSPAPLMRAT